MENKESGISLPASQKRDALSHPKEDDMRPYETCELEEK
jgi:hypothetical protein